MTLKEVKNWLKDCNYPDSVINQSFYDAKLQVPAPSTDNSEKYFFCYNILCKCLMKKWSEKFILNC